MNCFNLFFRQIVQENSVWSALNFFYVAIMFHIYHIWKVEHKTIKDSGYVLKGTDAGHSTYQNEIDVALKLVHWDQKCTISVQQPFYFRSIQ